MVLAALPARSQEIYQVRVEEYKAFRRDGYLHVPKLVDPAEVTELARFTDDMIAGKATLPGLPAPAAHLSQQERRRHYERIHMPHRSLELAERFLLHPRIVDVLEALIGPDILALQTMLFFKQPGDVIFFGGHVFHRSHRNDSGRSRRAFVSHYCNARSRVPWNHRKSYDGEEQGGAANHEHILARGTTHLPYGQPRFGTACAANAPELYGQRDDNNQVKSMMGDDNGFMVLVPHEVGEHEH